MELNEQFLGVIINCNLSRYDYSGYFGKEITDSLVQYDPGTNTVTVDERANEFYVRYAAIHECICCGKYKHLAPRTIEPQKRCAAIDKMIILSMPYVQRRFYVEERIEMFETLLERNLNPNLNDSFRESLRLLQEMRAI